MEKKDDQAFFVSNVKPISFSCAYFLLMSGSQQKIDLQHADPISVFALG